MGGAPESGGPAVTVIIPVWNVEPWLDECLASVEAQTLGTDRLRLIAIDDGSTDASGAVLDAFAAAHPWATVIHQANSGGPGGPRNAGLDVAVTEYVFFLDGDDFLGPEALERLVTMAERNHSDIVLGRIVGVDGRRDPADGPLFRRNVDAAELALVNRSGSIQKLFRRSLLEDAHLRFNPGVPIGEDGDFIVRAYVAARGISVLADYDCYYLRRRPGSQTTRIDREEDVVAAIRRIETERLAVTEAAIEAGPARDRLVADHIVKLTNRFGERWRSQEPGERRRLFEAGAEVARRWCTPAVQALLPQRAALRAWCLGNGRMPELEHIEVGPPGDAYSTPLVEDGRIYARLPHFRDGSGIPDACFDITRSVVVLQSMSRAAMVDGRLELAGEAYLRLVGGSVVVELRRAGRRPAYRFPVVPVPTPSLRDAVVTHPMAGYQVAIDPATAAGGASLARGTWTITLVVTAGAIRRERALRPPPGWEPPVGPVGDGPLAVRLVVDADRALCLVVGAGSWTDTWPNRVAAWAARIARKVRRIIRGPRRG